MLIDKRAAEIVMELLSVEDFYLPRHRKMYAVFCSCLDFGIDLDEVSAAEALNSAGHSSISEFVGQLILKCPSPANVETYCEIVKDKSDARARINVAGDILLGKSSSAEAIEKLERVEAKSQTVSSGYKEIVSEMQAEMAGRRISLDFPDWPILSSIGALMPEALTVICGSPGVSKSFFALEPIWRFVIEGSAKAAILELEKTSRFHTRRGLAQFCGRAEVTDSRWIRANPKEAQRIADEYKDHLEAMKKTIMSPHSSVTPDCDYLLRWLREKSAEGYDVLVIDPISFMAGQEKKHLDFDRFLRGCDKILQKYGNRIICVTHPKDTQGELTPSMSNIQGGRMWDRRADTILWLEYHKKTEVRKFIIDDNSMFPSATQELPFNRTLVTLKVRSRHNPQQIAYYFNKIDLRHIERGIVADGY